MTAKEYNNGWSLWADDVMRFAVRVCNNRAECEDAVQEALAALWQHRGEVPEAKGKGYLISVAYRQLMRSFRHPSVRLDSVEAMPLLQPQQPDTAFDTREAIEQALRTLPEVQRAVLQLRDVEGYTYRDIANTLDLNENQVQVYLFRARVAMRKQLKTMGYDEY